MFKRRCLQILAIILAVIFLPVTLFILLREMYYRGRPRPLPRKLRKSLKKDRVLDEEKQVVSIAEYNATHERQFTLAQVYGRCYVRSITDEEMDMFDTTPKPLPQGTGTAVAFAFRKGLLKDDFRKFEPFLAQDVRLVFYGKRTIVGRSSVSSYLRDDLVKWYREKSMLSQVRTCGYDGSAVVWIRVKEDRDVFVMFRVDGDLVKTVVVAPISAADFVKVFVCLHNLDEPRIDIETVKANRGVRISGNFENEMPCMCCGESSENLEWYSYSIANDFHRNTGRVSVCPHCGEMVEFHPEDTYLIQEVF